ncbi:MAG: hypothetical protein CO114_02515 [Euryarchaeota archaeon CG_4_9_14_3_um_filter_38_12]|nr:MAG: hypothetical protein CO114_02515 [Euryarchaeota archaeon CG_4_9_14_3_um_filter_38_12]
MNKEKERDEFDQSTIEILAKRASYICSNPECRYLTLCPSEKPDKYIYIGKVSHITAASRNGPRYDLTLTPEQRSSIENGIFLCSNCAEMVDKNKGLDFPVNLLKRWKDEHEIWVRENLNKSVNSLVTVIDGEHHAIGKGEVTGIDAQGPVFFRPGTKSIAEGEGTITATRITNKKEDKK